MTPQLEQPQMAQAAQMGAAMGAGYNMAQQQGLTPQQTMQAGAGLMQGMNQMGITPMQAMNTMGQMGQIPKVPPRPGVKINPLGLIFSISFIFFIYHSL